MFGLKGIAIASGVALLVGAGFGWKTRDAFCDAAQAKAELAMARAEVKAIQDRLLAADAAVAAYERRLTEDAAADRANREKADDTPANAGACLPADAARRLRDIK